MKNIDLATTTVGPGATGDCSATGVAQKQLLAVNRALKLLSACNEAVIRAKVERQLLNDICRLIVERGGYRMAWVGMAGTDDAGAVRAVAQFGDDTGHLEYAWTTWDEAEHGCGPSETAISTGQVQVNQGVPSNPATEPWRTSVLENGYQSSISLPLQNEAATFGVLTIYSGEPHAFTEEEANLLEELSGNLAYGIVHLREHRLRQLIEQELRESERRFRVLVEHAPDAIVVFDVDEDRMVDANANAERLFECGREEMLLRSPRDFYPPSRPDAASLRQAFREHGDRTPAWEQPVFERIVRSAKGHEKLCEVRLVRLPAGRRAQVRGSLIDITERKKREQELRQSTEAQAALKASTRHLKSILDNLFSYVALLDTDGIIQEVNKAPLDRSNIRREDAIGRYFGDAPWWSHDSQAQLRLIEAMAAARQGQTRRYEVVVKIAGDLVPIDFQISPIRNEIGEVAGLLATAMDISDRKKADAALRESEQRFRVLFESASDCLLLLSADGRIMDINQSGSWRLGYTKEEMLGRCIADFDAPEFAARVPERMAEIMRYGHATFESGHMRADGSHMPVEVNAMRVELGGQIVLFSVIRDITERKQTEHAIKEAMEQMQKKELAKTRFLAAAGHDLRQPLMAATLYIDTLERKGLTHSQKNIVDHLRQAMGTFKTLLDALLNISKLDAGATKPEYAQLNVPDLLIWLEDNFAPLARSKNLKFRMYFSTKQPLFVRSDPGLTKSILMNLVSNAIKFTPQGAILLSVRRRGQEALFQVWDTGIGIPDASIRHIFDEFYQVNNSHRDRASGLGLGLAIAGRALALLGQSIECRSQVGRGSVFGFRLPLVEAPAGGARHGSGPAAADHAPREFSPKGRRFVVVEDDALVAEAICKTLQVLGGKVQCFHNAEDTMAHADDIDNVDHYIVDYMLGGELSGLQLLHQLRRKSDRPVNAVLVTGDTSPAFVRAMADCHWPVLHKPVNIAELIASLGAQAI